MFVEAIKSVIVVGVKQREVGIEGIQGSPLKSEERLSNALINQPEHSNVVTPCLEVDRSNLDQEQRRLIQEM